MNVFSDRSEGFVPRHGERSNHSRIITSRAWPLATTTRVRCSFHRFARKRHGAFPHSFLLPRIAPSRVSIVWKPPSTIRMRASRKSGSPILPICVPKRVTRKHADSELGSIYDVKRGTCFEASATVPESADICPNCGNHHTRIVGQSGRPPVVHRHCDDCELVFTRPLDYEDEHRNTTVSGSKVAGLSTSGRRSR